MAAIGWRVEGVEFSEKAAQAAKSLGHKVHAGALENAPAPEHPVDLVVGWMVLEHLHDPIACLRKLRDWTTPDAWMVLSVPNAGTAGFRLFLDKWYDLHLPAHLHHFTPDTLAKLLTAGGWSIEKIHHQRMLNSSIVSMAYLAEGKGWSRSGRVLRWLTTLGGMYYLSFPFARLLGAAGQTGRMTVWARKTGRGLPTQMP